MVLTWFFASKSQLLRRFFVTERKGIWNLNEFIQNRFNVIWLICKILLRWWMRKRCCRKLGSLGKTAVCPFSPDSFLKILLLVFDLVFDNFLLFFATVLTVFDNFFNFGVWSELYFFELLLVFLFFQKKSSSFALKYLGDRRPEDEVLKFFLVIKILLRASLFVELNGFLG